MEPPVVRAAAAADRIESTPGSLGGREEFGAAGASADRPEGESAASLKLDGTETFDISGIEALNDGKTPKTVHVTATKEDGSKVEFDAVVRIDTPGEADYYRNGGILQYVLRNMLKS